MHPKSSDFAGIFGISQDAERQVKQTIEEYTEAEMHYINLLNQVWLLEEAIS